MSEVAPILVLLVLHCSHTFLPWRKSVIHQVISFLETERFVKP